MFHTPKLQSAMEYQFDLLIQKKKKKQTNRFAVRAGAKHVYATDVSNMINNASKIAEFNGMGDTITFVQGCVEQLELPKVDIIVSEWMGFCLLSDFMLDCLLQARDKFLVPGGLMFPDRTNLYIAGIEDGERYSAKVDGKYTSPFF
jgi:protein arginine N-methyltransferase 1